MNDLLIQLILFKELVIFIVVEYGLLLKAVRWNRWYLLEDFVYLFKYVLVL